MKNDLSIYIHYPFCKSKCPYCDFNSHVQSAIDHHAFLAAYEKELEFFASKIFNKKIKTIFFGGGTPSLMPLFLVEKILAKISQLWQIDKNCEITLEANPTSFESEKFHDLKKLGINRLSLGVQALQDDDLKFLGRQHSSLEAIKTIEMTAKIFDNFSFDLIYARPKQMLTNWQKELELAISFGTKHLSLYQLTIEKGTKFYSQFQRGEFVMPDENLSAEFYELTAQITKNKGFARYEISNYCQENYQSQHNLAYWKGLDYIGIGAGAHSRAYLNNEKERSAIMMVHEPNSWLKKVNENGWGVQNLEKISANELLQELVLMGLRLEKGIDDEIFLYHFNKKITQIFDIKKLQNLTNQGFIEFDKNFIKIPAEKTLLTNSIIEKILFEIDQKGSDPFSS